MEHVSAIARHPMGGVYHGVINYYLTSLSIKGLKNYEGFDEQALKAIDHGNALKLFPRLRL